MEKSEREIRAEAAKRLLNDPLLNEALDMFEKSLMEKIVTAPARDDEGRARCAYGLQALRHVRKHLRRVIADGKMAAINAANDVAKGPRRRFFG